MPIALDLTYPAILNAIKTEVVAGRTESHAFLVWFLQHYFRLDELEAHETVCDGPDDKGVDGIYVDSNLETIFVFQCKLVQNPKRTLGDTQLKEFAGSLDQFRTPDKIAEIAGTTANTELARVLTTANVAKLVTDGYAVKGVFVANIDRDTNATAYLQARDDIRLFDKPVLAASFVPVGPTEPVGTPVTFDVFGYDCAQYQIEDVKVVFAPLKGNDLIRLDGIASSELFAWNVRGSLGRTKVNKDIGCSIDSVAEHKNFLLYHNGLTILCQQLERKGDKITLSKYSVVNGCQSLTSLFDHRAKITDDLRIDITGITLSDDPAKDAWLGDPATAHNGVMANAKEFNKKMKLIFQSCGSKERPEALKASHEQLKAAGINTVMYVSDGTAHEWQTWRRSLHEFAPLLFKDQNWFQDRCGSPAAPRLRSGRP